MKRKAYETALKDLHIRLIGLQNHIIQTGKRVLIIFEGRDAAGKGGTIKRLMAPLNPRHARVIALTKPSPREQGQWYFQRYVKHLPAAGEIVAFDRSWYNRAGVEPVMGFCSEAEHLAFLTDVPRLETMLVNDGLILLKYWFSVSAAEQEQRLQDRAADPTKRWKISPIDLRARDMWDDYSRCKDLMFERTDHAAAPWYVVPSDDKKSARLNCLTHLLSQIPHTAPTDALTALPPRASNPDALVTSGTELSRQVPQVYS